MWEYSFEDGFVKVYYNNQEKLEEEVADMGDFLVSSLSDDFFKLTRDLLGILRKVASTFKSKVLSTYNGKVRSLWVIIEVPYEIYNILSIYGYKNEKGVKISNYASIKPSNIEKKLRISVFINNELYKKYILPLTGNLR